MLDESVVRKVCFTNGLSRSKTIELFWKIKKHEQDRLSYVSKKWKTNMKKTCIHIFCEEFAPLVIDHQMPFIWFYLNITPPEHMNFWC